MDLQIELPPTLSLHITCVSNIKFFFFLNIKYICQTWNVLISISALLLGNFGDLQPSLQQSNYVVGSKHVQLCLHSRKAPGLLFELWIVCISCMTTFTTRGHRSQDKRERCLFLTNQPCLSLLESEQAKTNHCPSHVQSQSEPFCFFSLVGAIFFSFWSCAISFKTLHV